MMKILKKISLFMLVLVFVTTTFPAHAEGSTDDTKYKSLTSKEIATLQEIFEEDPEFKELIEDSGKVLSMSSEVKAFYEEVPAGRMSASSLAPPKLRLTVTVTQGRYSNERIVIAHAKWLTPPLIKRKDMLAIAWGNGHAFKNHQSNITNFYKPSLPVFPKLDNAEPNYGLGYKFNVLAPPAKGSVLENSIESVTLTATLAVDKAGTTNVVAKHTTYKLGSISVSFGPKGPTPSIGFSAGVDTTVATTSFRK